MERLLVIDSLNENTSNNQKSILTHILNTHAQSFQSSDQINEGDQPIS